MRKENRRRIVCRILNSLRKRATGKEPAVNQQPSATNRPIVRVESPYEETSETPEELLETLETPQQSLAEDQAVVIDEQGRNISDETEGTIPPVAILVEREITTPKPATKKKGRPVEISSQSTASQSKERTEASIMSAVLQKLDGEFTQSDDDDDEENEKISLYLEPEHAQKLNTVLQALKYPDGRLPNTQDIFRYLLANATEETFAGFDEFVQARRMQKFMEVEERRLLKAMKRIRSKHKKLTR